MRVGLDDAEFTVVDLETTGGRAGPGTIIEIGAYRMVGKRLTETFSQLVRPQGGVVPRFITGLTSITTEMIREAPPIEQVLPRFREFMGDRVMVAHNAAFDFGFLRFRISPHLWNRARQSGAVHAADGAPVHAVAQAPPARFARGAFRTLARGTASRTRRRADGGRDSLDFSRDGAADGNHAARSAARRPSSRNCRQTDRAARAARGNRGASACARRLPDAQRARRLALHRQGAAAPGAGELVLQRVGEGEDGGADLARLQNRDAGDALGARGGARRSAADPRAEAAVQPDAEIGGARVFYQGRSDGRVSARDALDQDDRRGAA